MVGLLTIPLTCVHAIDPGPEVEEKVPGVVLCDAEENVKPELPNRSYRLSSPAPVLFLEPTKI